MLAQQGCAVVIGSSGAIGHALIEQLQSDASLHHIYAFSRSQSDFDSNKVTSGYIDVCDEASIQAACTSIPMDTHITHVIVAIGVLHTQDFMPEKSLRDLSAEKLHEVYATNTIGPTLVAKHFIPRMPKHGRSLFAALSARVGSIGDNHLGGWYAYRASKAALNMILKNLSIEAKRSHPDIIIIGLHPGTVDSALSKPFQANVPEGKLFNPTQAASQLIDVMAKCTHQDSGEVLAWDGQRIEH